MNIEDACNTASTCTDITTTVQDSSTEYGSINHNLNILQSATIFGVNYDLMSFQRSFSISGHDSGNSGITAIVRINDGDYPCLGATDFTVSGSVNENCTQTSIIPMYLNLTDKTFVYEKRVETITFTVPAHHHKAAFKTKWGIQNFWKYIIKVEDELEYLNINQEFHIVQDGVDILIHSATKNKNPFMTTGPQASWGLYGNLQYSLNYETEDPTIRQILVYPIVPSLAIPWDKCGTNCAPSVNNYGFYDYNAIEGGFTYTDLGAQDGGKDFYYPYWIRQMTENPIMRELADKRWAKNWLHEDIPNGDWVPPVPSTYNWPFGSFVKDSVGNFIHSAIFTDINNESVLYNNCSPSDIFEKIVLAGGGDQLYCPITLISNIYGLNDSVGTTEDHDEFIDDSGNIMTDDSGVDIYA